MFAVTNIDDIVVLALFFGRAGHRHRAVPVVAGQYLGIAAILVLSVAGALGAGQLPPSAVPYLGILPLVLGLRAAWRAWRERRNHGDTGSGDRAGESGPVVGERVGVLDVATVTLANGGDNIGVYVPVFAVAGAGGLIIYVVVFLVGVGLWCVAGWFVATRPVVAGALARWGHLVLPVVLIAIGATILVEGGSRA
ncbi:MAG TPA: cadmium resistance transporter [Pseudonocardia sp.]|jgi:cadmium resistance protein CadD (predicted permease)|nr:cadmium resistance transporter [Pseudonocardia sp.]